MRIPKELIQRQVVVSAEDWSTIPVSWRKASGRNCPEVAGGSQQSGNLRSVPKNQVVIKKYNNMIEKMNVLDDVVHVERERFSPLQHANAVLCGVGDEVAPNAVGVAMLSKCGFVRSLVERLNDPGEVSQPPEKLHLERFGFELSFYELLVLPVSVLIGRERLVQVLLPRFPSFGVYNHVSGEGGGEG